MKTIGGDKPVLNPQAGLHLCWCIQQKVSDYDQEIPQSHTADQHTAPRERATEHL